MNEGLSHFEALDHCPVCASTDLVSFKKRTFDIDTLTEENIKITDSDYGKIWDLDRCQNCTHVFANPAPSSAFIQSLYTQTKDPEYEDESIGRGKNFLRILRFLQKIHPQRGTLLDVGAATGILLSLARKKGWDIEGIEPSAWAVRMAKDKYDLTLVEGNLETANLKSHAYTAITLVDFIEHIPHPREALVKVHKALKPGGTICLVTPDIRSLAARMVGKKWWHFRPGHLAYFTKKSLSTLLEQTGFRAIHWKKYAWTFSAHYLLSRKRMLNFLVKNPRIALFWRRVPIKLALRDSFEVYATKGQAE
jgi:2-polyprenyl-3-methyl-5-hydroxy-6-metoxy-1,4-benzoquinol methylase